MKYKQPEEFFKYLKEEFGLSVFENSERCLAIAADMFEGDKQVNFLIKTAFDNKVYLELLKAKNSTSENKFICIERSIKILTDDCCLENDKAIKTVGWLASNVYSEEWTNYTKRQNETIFNTNNEEKNKLNLVNSIKEENNQNNNNDVESLIQKAKDFIESENYEDALKILKPLVDQGNAQALVELGDLFYYGYGVPQNNIEAFKCFEKAAEHGNAEGQNSLGWCYYNGDGVTQDINMAIKYFKLAANQGNCIAQAGLGQIFYTIGNTQDFKEAFRYFKLAADQGDIDSQIAIGKMYYYNHGVSQNYNEAFRYWKLAADQGNVEGQIWIGFMNKNGLGVDQNYSEAFKYYKLAADQGSSDAQFQLGFLYENGLGISQNYGKAAKYYKLAADQGSSDAQIALDRIQNPNNYNNQNSSGCFITTAVCDSFNKPDDCYELTTFRQFRDNWLTKEIDGESLIKEYYNYAPKIVENIDNLPNKAEIYLDIWNRYLKDCLHFIEDKKYAECKTLYIKMVRELEKKYC